MGNKIKLVKRGLVNLFPQNINTFVDLFCGSGVVSMNTNAQHYILNDRDVNVVKLHEMFHRVDAHEIIRAVETFAKQFNMEWGAGSFDSRSRKFDSGVFEQHKLNYNKLKDFYNQQRDIEALYTLLIYCFSHQMRFNSKGEFNMPCGHDHFTEDNRKWILDSQAFYTKDVSCINNDFRALDLHGLLTGVENFVYMDPPYFNTTATYNENSGWSINDENELHELCETLDGMNVRWAMSNVFHNKGVENTQLIDWCTQRGYNVHHFDGFTYSACGKGNSNTDEVLIMNYEPPKSKIAKKLF